jgi:hypothetical protein
MSQQGSLIRGFFHWVRLQIIQDVPKEAALCELDCRKDQCSQGEWEACERRLNRAEGELMPSPKNPAA